MTLLEAIILGIIQGLSEFIPISSSGHLALGKHFFGISEPDLPFIIMVHLGTLVPVFIIYRKDIWAIIRRPFQKMTALLIIATIPAVIAGLFLEDRVEQALASLHFLAAGFIITGIVLLFSDRISKTNKDEENISKFDAALVGIAQAIAIFPGISRSGATLSAALGRKINREAAARFVFLMSIPIILGAAALYTLQIIRGDLPAYAIDWPGMAAGFAAAALSGYLAISYMLSAIRRARLRIFAIYVFTLAAIILLDIFALSGRIFA